MALTDYDDKDLVIVGVFCICIVAMLAPLSQEAVSIVEKALYVLAGIAMGRVKS
jgi:hypothetical protein